MAENSRLLKAKLVLSLEDNKAIATTLENRSRMTGDCHVRICESWESESLSFLLDKKQEAKKAQLCFGFDEKLNNFKKMLFGKSSEKKNLSDSYRKNLQKKVLLEAESLAPAPKKEELKKLEEIKVNHALTKEELSDIAGEYGHSRDSEWEDLTIYDESEEIDVKVQSYVRKKHRCHKYRLKVSKNTEKEIIVTAPSPKRIVPSSKYSAEFAVDVVSEKYLDFPYLCGQLIFS